MAGNLRILDLCENIFPFLEIFDEILYRSCVSTHFFHALQVELKMRNMPFSERMNVSFLTNHDFVDESGCVSVLDGYPNLLDTSQFVLEMFEEKHKVPNCKNMTFHKYFHALLSFYNFVDFMAF